MLRGGKGFINQEIGLCSNYGHTDRLQLIMGKLAKRFNGPFQVLEQVRIVAYRLKLSEETCIHPIFLFTDETTQRLLELIKEVQLPTQFVQHHPIIVPLAILDY